MDCRRGWEEVSTGGGGGKEAPAGLRQAGCSPMFFWCRPLRAMSTGRMMLIAT